MNGLIAKYLEEKSCQEIDNYRAADIVKEQIRYKYKYI